MDSPRRLRILMLHGYTQSGPLFHAKTRALEKILLKVFPSPNYTVSLVYSTAPIRIQPADIPGFSSSHSTSNSTSDTYDSHTSAKEADGDSSVEDTWGWWVRRGEQRGSYTYAGMDTGMRRIAEVLQADGPFDGVVGFSQGGAAAGMVASLLEPGRKEVFDKMAKEHGGMAYPDSFVATRGQEKNIEDPAELVHPPLRFAVSYSGFAALDANQALYNAFYRPKIATPMLHFIGSVDTVVEEARSLSLVDSCSDGEGVGGKRVVRHPGGHFLPNQRQFVAALVDFIREAMGWNETQPGHANQQSHGAKRAGKSKEDDLDGFPF